MTSRIRDLAIARSWSTETLLDLLIDYIESHDEEECVMEYLSLVAQEEDQE